MLTDRNREYYNITMKTLQVDEVERNFADVMDIVKKGEEVTISDGMEKENIAILIPFSKYVKYRERKLGLLESRASFAIKSDFKMSNEEFLSL